METNELIELLDKVYIMGVQSTFSPAKARQYDKKLEEIKKQIMEKKTIVIA